MIINQIVCCLLLKWSEEACRLLSTNSERDWHKYVTLKHCISDLAGTHPTIANLQDLVCDWKERLPHSKIAHQMVLSRSARIVINIHNVQFLICARQLDHAVRQSRL